MTDTCNNIVTKYTDEITYKNIKESNAKIVPYIYVDTFFKYISKNNNVCYNNTIITDGNFDSDFIVKLTKDPIKINSKWMETTNFFNFKNTYKLDEIKKCLIKENIIILPINVITYSNLCKVSGEYTYKNKQSHYNLIVIKNKNIYYFDPMTDRDKGDDFFNTQKKICEEIKSHLGIHDYYISIHDTCPFSLQRKARKQRPIELKNNEGLCVAWCLLIAHLLVLNKESSLEDIVECVLKIDNLDEYIRKYLTFLKVQKEREEFAKAVKNRKAIIKKERKKGEGKIRIKI
jgi:hypothetical protein